MLDFSGPVRLHNDSAPPLPVALARLRRAKPQHAHAVWKRLLFVALTRMAKRQPTLARIIAVEALNAVGTIGPVLRYRKTGFARGYLTPLKAMEQRRLRPADLQPRAGLHPEVLKHRYAQTEQLFVKGRGTRAEADRLLRAWGRRPLTDAGWRGLVEATTDRQRARLFLARVARVTPASLKTMLARGNRARE